MLDAFCSSYMECALCLALDEFGSRLFELAFVRDAATFCFDCDC